MKKNGFIEELKILVDAIAIANEFDYVPSKIERIKEGIDLFALTSSPDDIMKYSGLGPSEVTNRLVSLINLEYEKLKKD